MHCAFITAWGEGDASFFNIKQRHEVHFQQLNFTLDVFCIGLSLVSIHCSPVMSQYRAVGQSPLILRFCPSAMIFSTQHHYTYVLYTLAVKHLKLGLCNFHHTVAPSLWFLWLKFHPEILTGSSQTGASNKGGMVIGPNFQTCTLRKCIYFNSACNIN